MLKFEDVSSLFSRTSGIKEEMIVFNTVSCIAGVRQPRGLFIPVSENSGSLKDAISNGAIAAVWSENEPVPAYTPNYFPIFYSEDLLKGLEELMKSYQNYLMHQDKIAGTTKFIFQHKELLNEKDATYDIAVMAEMINQFGNHQNKAGEE